MMGVSMAPATARPVADMVMGAEPFVDRRRTPLRACRTITGMSRKTAAFAVLVLAVGACSRDKTRTLRVRMVNGDGKSTTGVVWWATDVDAEYGTPVGPVREGEVVLRDLPAGPVVLVALPNGFVVPSEGWPRKVVPSGVKETVLVLDAGASRTLRILGWDAEWSGLAYLAATSDLEPSQHGVDDDGTLRLEGLRPGVRYNLYVREFETGRCALLRGLPANEPWPEIEMRNGRDLTGRIVFPKGCDSANIAVMVDRAVMMDAQVEEDGSFRIRAVPPGRWTVVAYTTYRDQYFATTIEARTGEPALLDLTNAARK